MQENSVKAKMNHNAKHLRFVSRAQAFQQKRKTYDQLDYLAYYQPSVREAILYSMQAPVPDPLPPLGLTTISFYRRSRLPVFKPIDPETGQIEGHMTYQSLWILSSLQEKSFIDYQQVVKQFERDLCLYLSANSTDIQEMAVIAAGNKIIGKEKDILGIVTRDIRQLWVLANHIYQNKISLTKMFTYLASQQEIAYKTLFELSMLLQNEVAQAIMGDQTVLDQIMTVIGTGSDAITIYALRIAGNIVAAKDEYISIFCKRNILDILGAKLSSSNGQVRRDTCWLISNLLTKKASATLAIQNSGLMTKLIDLFSYQVLINIKKEITYIFCYLAYYADRKQALVLLGHPNVLQICYSQLCVEDIDLNVATLLLLKEVLELGDSLKNQQEQNFVMLLMKQARALCSQISKKSYSENNEVSSISLQILGVLEEDE